MDALLQDVRYAFRQLLKTPVFWIAAVGTLAIGIGATTAIFSTVNATLLRPLPFPRFDDLVGVRTRLTDGRITSGFLAPVEIARLNDPQLSISRAAGISSQPFDASLLRDDGPPIHVVLSGVSEGFFDLLGLPMARGQGFTHEHHVVTGPSAPLAIVLSHRVWTEMFGSDSNIIGKPVRFAEAPVTTTVVGVAARELDLPHGTDFWYSLRLDPQGVAHFLDGIVRMRTGTRLERLRPELSRVMAGLARDFPTSDTAREYVVQPLVTSIVGDLGSTLLIILGATALLLVLASVNVTNLLLARGTVRTREVAVRAALGASRGRIVRQLLTESMVLATAGALAGLGLAYASVRLLLVLGASKLPRLDTVPFDARVLLFAFAVLLLSGVTMGVAPAWRLARTDIRALINESGRSASGGRATSRVMGGMIIAEIALAITLVAGAGWLVQSFAKLRTTDPGFTPTGRLVVDVRPTRNFPEPAQALAWSDELLRRMGAVNGVDRVGSASTFPLRADRDGTLLIELQGEHTDPTRARGARSRLVTPGFFDAMGIRLLVGRDFTADDRQKTMPVAIVNRAFVRRYLSDRDPLHVQFAFGYPAVDPQTLRTIVGVVQDVRYKSLSEEPEPAFYLTQGQMPFPLLRQAVVVTTTRGTDPSLVIPEIQAELKRFDPQLAVDYELASHVVALTLSRQQLGMTLMMIFGVTALALAAVGIYGVVAYAAAQRRNEVATRIALGARPGDVFWLMMTQGQRLALAGTIIGLAAAYAAGRAVAGSVYAMRASDPLILVTATVLVVGITLLATVIPAARATRVDPMLALRSE